MADLIGRASGKDLNFSIFQPEELGEGRFIFYHSMRPFNNILKKRREEGI